MALIGLVDPSHDERAADEPGRLPQWLPLDQVLGIAAREGPGWSPWPFELLQGALATYQERDYISVTMLTGGCARGSVLERREDYILDADGLYAALRGTLIHQTLQHAARPNSLAEARFHTSVTIKGLRETIDLSCSPDIITWDPDGLGDYKVTENPPMRYPWRGHTNQVTWNQWVVRHAERWTMDGQEFDIPFNPHTWVPEHLYLVYLAPKGPQVLEVMKTMLVPNPKGTMVKRRMPYVAPDEEIEDELFPRLKAMAQALAAYPEWPWPKGDHGPGFEGPAGWACPGRPWCALPLCLAKRYPHGLKWENVA